MTFDLNQVNLLFFFPLFQRHILLWESALAIKGELPATRAQSRKQCFGTSLSCARPTDYYRESHVVTFFGHGVSRWIKCLALLSKRGILFSPLSYSFLLFFIFSNFSFWYFPSFYRRGKRTEECGRNLFSSSSSSHSLAVRRFFYSITEKCITFIYV